MSNIVLWVSLMHRALKSMLLIVVFENWTCTLNNFVHNRLSAGEKPFSQEDEYDKSFFRETEFVLILLFVRLFTWTFKRRFSDIYLLLRTTANGVRIQAHRYTVCDAATGEKRYSCDVFETKRSKFCRCT
jgi:hypothetical protein